MTLCYFNSNQDRNLGPKTGKKIFNIIFIVEMLTSGIFSLICFLRGTMLKYCIFNIVPLIILLGFNIYKYLIILPLIILLVLFVSK